jgi:succinate dehydrogenase/fumarate reductase cytochrome b subunit
VFVRGSLIAEQISCQSITLTLFTSVLYGYALAYLVAPETFASANIIELVHGLPEALKYTGKAILAAPFAFHSLNGLRHLAWDSGRCTFLLPDIHLSYSLLSCMHSLDTQGCLFLWLRCTWCDSYRYRRPRSMVNILSGLRPINPLLFRAAANRCRFFLYHPHWRQPAYFIKLTT